MTHEQLIKVSNWRHIGLCLSVCDTFHSQTYNLHSEVSSDPLWGYMIYSFAELIAWRPARAQLWRLKRPIVFHQKAPFINKHIITIERAIHYAHHSLKPTRERW